MISMLLLEHPDEKPILSVKFFGIIYSFFLFFLLGTKKDMENSKVASNPPALKSFVREILGWI